MRRLSSLGILLLTVGYLIWPVDFIPDFLVGPGQVDDLAILIAGVTQAYRLWRPKQDAKSVS